MWEDMGTAATVSAILWSQRFWKEAKIQIKRYQLSNSGSTIHDRHCVSDPIRSVEALSVGLYEYTFEGGDSHPIGC